MSDNKKYYYLKLKDDFFDGEEMLILESMPDGYLYSNILLKLYLKSLKNNGKLMFRGCIPYTPTVLSAVVRHPVGIVEKALKVFQDMGLVEMLDSGAIYMLDIQNFIGKSSTEADRIREYRRRIDDEKTTLLPESVTNVTTNVQQMYDECTPEIRDKRLEIRDKSIDKEKDIMPGAESTGQEETAVNPSETEISESEIFITLTLNDKSEHPIRETDVKEFEELYPAVDVKQELRKMKGWLIANPAKRKTKRGIMRFVNSWLAKEQDKGGNTGHGNYRGNPQTVNTTEPPRQLGTYI